MLDTSKKARTELVWDVLVRAFHWTLVIGFLLAYFSEGEPLSLYVWAVGGVLLASYAHKENLIAAMLDGRKRPLP